MLDTAQPECERETEVEDIKEKTLEHRHWPPYCFLLIPVVLRVCDTECNKAGKTKKKEKQKGKLAHCICQCSLPILFIRFACV